MTAGRCFLAQTKMTLKPRWPFRVGENNFKPTEAPLNFEPLAPVGVFSDGKQVNFCDTVFNYGLLLFVCLSLYFSSPCGCNANAFSNTQMSMRVCMGHARVHGAWGMRVCVGHARVHGACVCAWGMRVCVGHARVHGACACAWGMRVCVGHARVHGACAWGMRPLNGILNAGRRHRRCLKQATPLQGTYW